MIEVERLSKTYYVHRKRPGLRGSLRALFVRDRVERKAVDEVSFRVDEGEIVGLVGANGAGKTTLVKMLAGIIQPAGGTARVLGFDPWKRENAFRSQIALIMGQKAQLWWDLPAADCFLLLKEIYRIPDDRYRATLDDLAQILDVTGLLEIQIRRLSLGERMKMELIAALLHGPRVVYLDEPTIGLDLTAQRAIRDFILQWRERNRPAMLLTSHYMEDIERLCRRILILREGVRTIRSVQGRHGPPAQGGQARGAAGEARGDGGVARGRRVHPAGPRAPRRGGRGGRVHPRRLPGRGPADRGDGHRHHHRAHHPQARGG